MAKKLHFPLRFDKLISDDILIENDRAQTFVCRKAGPSEWWCIEDWKLRRLVRLANRKVVKHGKKK